MVIIVDSSISVGKANFQTVTAFLKSLLGYLPVHPDGIRVSLIRYASRADVITYLDEDMNKTEKAGVVASMAFRGGGTNTHLALKRARTALLTPERGDRPDVPDLVILTTDGSSTNKNWTSAEAAALKANENLKIFVIGIGNEVADTELVAVASRPEMVYKLTDFSQLTEIVKNLARFSCSEMLLSSYSTTENENKTETTLEQTTKTHDPTLFNPKTLETESTLEPKITEQSTLLDATIVFDTETQSSTHIFTKDTSTTSPIEARTSTAPTSFHTTTFLDSADGEARAFDGPRAAQRSTAYFPPRTSMTSAVTTTAESFLPDTNLTQFDHFYVTNLTKL
ncbi:unnamed protein product, partial [Candidula unifasciata]